MGSCSSASMRHVVLPSKPTTIRGDDIDPDSDALSDQKPHIALSSFHILSVSRPQVIRQDCPGFPVTDFRGAPVHHKPSTCLPSIKNSKLALSSRNELIQASDQNRLVARQFSCEKDVAVVQAQSPVSPNIHKWKGISSLCKEEPDTHAFSPNPEKPPQHSLSPKRGLTSLDSQLPHSKSSSTEKPQRTPSNALMRQGSGSVSVFNHQEQYAQRLTRYSRQISRPLIKMSSIESISRINNPEDFSPKSSSRRYRNEPHDQAICKLKPLKRITSLNVVFECKADEMEQDDHQPQNNYQDLNQNNLGYRSNGSHLQGHIKVRTTKEFR